MESEQKLPTLEHLRAATVYEDESGYEVVNLPDGWALGCSDLLPLLIETVDRYEARAEALSEEIIKYEALNAEHVKRIGELSEALREALAIFNGELGSSWGESFQPFYQQAHDALLAAGTK